MQKVKADFGAYVQDAWTMKRLTLNYGGRFDHFNSEVPRTPTRPRGCRSSATSRPSRMCRTGTTGRSAGWFLRPVRDWQDRVEGEPEQIRAFRGRQLREHVQPDGLHSKPRAWIDADGNCSIFDANGNIQKNEVIGGTANFGQSSSASRPDPDLARGYNWECSVSVQHELIPKVSVTGGYYRRRFGNLRINDNLNLTRETGTRSASSAPSIRASRRAAAS